MKHIDNQLELLKSTLMLQNELLHQHTRQISDYEKEDRDIISILDQIDHLNFQSIINAIEVYIDNQTPSSEAISDGFVRIPKGNFMMGSNMEDDEQPIHKVTIDYDIAIGKYLVTFDEFDQFCDETGKERIEDFYKWGRGNKPVIGIEWGEAVDYCNWKSKKEGKKYRLPSEAEWEYACRAGTNTKWYCGDTADYLDDYAWHYHNSGKTSHPVGSKKPNPWGLYDMHGNVAEWCADYYTDNYQSVPTDGSPNTTGKQLYMVTRGGTVESYDLSYLRTTSRAAIEDVDVQNIGLRLVHEL